MAPGPRNTCDYFDPLAVVRVAIVTPATAAPDAASAITPAVDMKNPPFFDARSVVTTTTPVIEEPAMTEIGALEPMISPAALTISAVKRPRDSRRKENCP